MSTLLSLSGITKRFGGVTALQSVAFDVQEGTIQSVIGPNGAGKTSLFNVMTGFYHADEGSIQFAGQPVFDAASDKALPSPDIIAKLGVARTFQSIRLFGRLTALENVLQGRFRAYRSNPLDILLRLPRFKRERDEQIDQAQTLLKFVGLQDLADRQANTLPYGEQRRLEIARALATEPRLLLLDEPAAGMNNAETTALMALIRDIRDRGVTVLLIEHDMSLVMKISDSIVVLDHGQIIARGTPGAIRSDERVIAAYLGTPLKEV